MITRLSKTLTILCLLAVSMVSCVETCDEPVYPAIVVNAYTAGKQVTAIDQDPILIRGIDCEQEFGMVGESFILNYPLDKEETSYEIIVGGNKDTLRICYQVWMEFLTEECGCAAVGVIDTFYYTTNVIRNVELNSAGIGRVFTNSDETNEENFSIDF